MNWPFPYIALTCSSVWPKQHIKFPVYLTLICEHDWHVGSIFDDWHVDDDDEHPSHLRAILQEVLRRRQTCVSLQVMAEGHSAELEEHELEGRPEACMEGVDPLRRRIRRIPLGT